METNEFELIVSQPPKPLWRNLLAAVCFTIAIFAIYAIATQPHFSHLEPEERTEFNKNVLLIIAGICLGIYYSVVTTLMIDTDTEKMVSVYSVGPISRKRTSKLPALDYVGIHKNKDDIYLIRIWYDKNKRFTMCYTEEKKAALQFAQMVSQKLKLDLLDATEKGNSKWIETNA